MKSIYDDNRFFAEYAQMSRSRQGLSGASEWHLFKAFFPDLSGKKVLDLGCGYGWHCKYAIECGAEQVLGIDLSEKMIREAKAKNSDPKITWQVCGIEAYEYPGDTFDCVISNLALHYIKDIDEIFRKVYLTLKADGVFLMNIEHPVFTAGINQDWVYDSNGKPLHWPVDNYFYPGERVTRFLGHTVTKQHHTLTQIFMGLIHAGFRLAAIEEAMPHHETMHIPGRSDEMRRPMMLLIKSLKE